MNQYELSFRDEISGVAFSLSEGGRQFTMKKLKSKMKEYNPEREGRRFDKKFNKMLKSLKEARVILMTNFQDGQQWFQFNYDL